MKKKINKKKTQKKRHKKYIKHLNNHDDLIIKN